MNALKLINRGSSKLKKLQILSHKLDSEIILSKVLNKKREEILINLNQKMSLETIRKFNLMINRRYAKEPMAYILKEKEFWSKNFKINNHTLIPRPETELMVEILSKIFKNTKIFILDIGTGSGCILISLLSELKDSKGIGVDISREALIIAKENAKIQGITDKIKFWNRNFVDIYNSKFDLVVSNPPYIIKRDINNLADDIKHYEPKLALDGGNDGLDVIKKVIYKTKNILKVNGILALEIGNGQYNIVSKLLIKNNFKVEHKIKDYRNNIRCLISKLIR